MLEMIVVASMIVLIVLIHAVADVFHAKYDKKNDD